MVVTGTGTAGTRFVSKNYPVTEGLEAGTTKTDGRKINLESEEDAIDMPEKEKKVID